MNRTIKAYLTAKDVETTNPRFRHTQEVTYKGKTILVQWLDGSGTAYYINDTLYYNDCFPVYKAIKRHV